MTERRGETAPPRRLSGLAQRVSRLSIDGLIAIGGGSTVGLGKAIALRTDLPQIGAPTTYAGSEMTPILGETRDGAKVTQTTSKVLPETVIYDVDYTLGLPGSSGAQTFCNKARRGEF